MNNKEIMVSILMPTYNHVKYIGDAIEGVLSQKTEFGIELIIHDDASTDGTTKIVEEYARKNTQIIKLLKEDENQYCKGVFIFDQMLSHASGKYVALCEGDDYWIDEFKLAKQISFLETHHDYSMCIHNAWQQNEKTKEKTLINTFETEGSYPLEKQVICGLGSKFPATASYVYRMEYARSFPDEFKLNLVGDYPIRVYNASKGNVYYFMEPMSVYRYLSNGSYMSNICEHAEKYIEYIQSITKLYSIINRYLEFRFDDIYTKKIISDYLGLATVMLQNNIDFSNCDETINTNLLQKCFDVLNENETNASLGEFCNNNENVWIYGASNLAKLIYKKMYNMGITINGFVISDGCTKPDLFEGQKVLYLSTVLAQYSNNGYVLAVQPINLDSIISNLNRNNVSNYYCFDFDTIN